MADVSDIQVVNIPVQNQQTFNESMKNLGYNMVAKNFLVKNFGNIEINITRRNNMVESITGYLNNEVVKIPDQILTQVKNNIQQCL